MAGPVHWNLPPVSTLPLTAGAPRVAAVLRWPLGRRQQRGFQMLLPRGPVTRLFTPPQPIYAAPSPWGEGEGEGQGSETYITQAAQAYATYSSAADPRVQLATLEAKIANYKRMKATAPGVLRGFYTNEIAKMEAKAAALREKLAIQQEGEAATRQWRGLGQAGLAVGVVGGVVAVGILAVVGAKLLKAK